MSIEQLPSGKWRVRWWEGGAHPSKTFDTKKEARAHDLAMHARSARARSQQQQNLSFVAYADVWLEQLGAEGELKPATLRRYAVELQYVILPWARRNRWKIATVTYQDLLRLVESREADQVAKGTRAKTVTVLRSAFRDAKRLGYRMDNPAEGLRAKQDTSQRRSSIPTIDQVEAVAAACPYEPAGLWLRLMALTGARPSEAIGLRWEHVDRETRLITLGDRPVVEAGGRRYVADVAKTGAGTARRVPLLRRLEPVLDRLAELRRDDQPWLFPGRRTELAGESVFGSLPMSHEYARGRLNAGCTEAGLRPVQPYEVRHVYATMLLEAGMTDFEITRLMGHRSIVTTTRVYGHLRPERLGQVQDQLDQAFGEG